jgi:ABC-2 type transport system permease protein
MSETSLAMPQRFGTEGALLRAVAVMWRRQMLRFLRSRSRVIGSLAQPLFFLLAFGYGFSAVFEAAGQGSYIQFLAPGIIGMSIIFSSIFTGMEVIWDRQFGFLKETLVAPVPRSAIMIGRTLGGATVSVAQGLLVFLATLAIGFRPENWALVPVAIVVMALISIMFTAFGTAVATRLKDMQGFQLIMNFLVMPLFFLSGALFPLQGLPTAMQWIIHANPLAYGVDALRDLLIGASYYGLVLDFAVLIVLSTALLAAGALLFRRIEA